MAAGVEGASQSRQALVAESEEITRGPTIPFWKWLWWRMISAPPKFLKIRVTKRVASIQKIIGSADPRADSLLLSLLEDPWVVVREVAASGLGKLRVVSAVPDLCRLVTTDYSPQVRRVAAQSLATLGDPRGIDAILKLAVDHPRSLSVCLEYISRFGEAAVPRLIAALVEQSIPVSTVAIQALGRMGSRSVVPKLLKALYGGREELRLPILRVLAELDVPDLGARLVPLLADPTPEVREAVLEYLAKFPSAAAVSTVKGLLKSSDSQHRQLAVLALRAGDFAEVFHLFSESLRDSNAVVRKAAATALGAQESPLAAASLLESIHDPDCDTRCEVIRSLGSLAEPRALEPLLGLVDSEDRAIRLATVTALGSIGDGRAVPPLIGNLSHESDSKIRQAIVRSLGALGDPSAIPVLRTLLVENSPIRVPALIAISEIGTTEATEVLVSMLHDPSEQMRYHACMGLCQTGEESVLPALEGLLKEGSSGLLSGLSRGLKSWNSRRALELAQRALAISRQRDQELRSTLKEQAVSTEPADRDVAPSSRGSGLGWKPLLALVACLLVVGVGIGAWALSRSPGVSGRQQPAQTEPRRGAVVGIGYTSGGVALVAASGGGIEEWRPSAKTAERVHKVGEQGLAKVEFSRDGSLLAMVGSQGEVRVLKVGGKSDLLRVPHSADSQSRLWFDREGQRLGVWDRRNGVRIWDLTTGSLSLHLQPDSNATWENAALNLDFNRLLVTVPGSGVTVINLDRERPIGALAGLANRVVQQLEISPDGTLVAVSGPQGEISVFEMKSRQPVQRFASGLGSVRVLQFSQSGRLLVGGGVGGVFCRSLNDEGLARADATYSVGGRPDEIEVIDHLALDESRGLLLGGGSEEGGPLLMWKLPKLEASGVTATSAR